MKSISPARYGTFEILIHASYDIDLLGLPISIYLFSHVKFLHLKYLPLLPSLPFDIALDFQLPCEQDTLLNYKVKTTSTSPRNF